MEFMDCVQNANKCQTESPATYGQVCTSDGSIVSSTDVLFGANLKASFCHGLVVEVHVCRPGHRTTCARP